ncbi:MAG: helix-turn-helix transcriptional regulator [Gemmatimonadetes bacterium]|nr:helix-turn-helix transcriptional regulator [Gemmatimonadota bacterium]
MKTQSAVTPTDFRALRLQLGTQEQVAALLGVSRSLIAAWETGRRAIRPETFAQLEALVAASDVSQTESATGHAPPEYPVGWVRSEIPACLRLAAGLDCRMPPGVVNRDACGCGGYPVLDHVRMWLMPDGRYAVTSEPYGVDGAALASFVTICKGLGLNVEVSPASPYSPGLTVLLIITRRETQDDYDDEWCL